MLEELYSCISPACCYITVFLDDEKISDGTGFAFLPNGQVLTAAHVVTGRFPIRASEYNDPSQKIFCKFPGLPVTEYSILLCCIEIQVPGFLRPVQLDLAVLNRKVPHAGSAYSIPALIESPRLGQRVFMAGYSEELRLPSTLTELCLPRRKGLADAFKAAMEKRFTADMIGPLIKQGHIGNLRRVIAQDSNGRSLECDVMYIDNAMHPGASGGPVFKERGEAVGLMSEYVSNRHHRFSYVAYDDDSK